MSTEHLSHESTGPAPKFSTRYPRPGGTSRVQVITVLPVLLVSACSLAPGPSVPAPVAAVPADFAEAARGGSYEPLEWWTAFDDPVLNTVIDTALASNFDLAEAVGRVQQARAQARIAKAAYFPSVSASGSVSGQNTPANAGFGAQFQALAGGDGQPPDSGAATPTFDRIDITTYSVSADFAYELDFWGRVRNDARAAGSEWMASEADFQAARLGVLAQSITAYFQIVDLRRRVALSEETVGVLGERETLTETRYNRGLVSSFELYQVRQDLRTTQAALPQLESQLTEAEGRLAVLLGRYRRDLEGLLPDSLAPELPESSVPPGIPAELLYQRPDVRAAFERMEGARFRIGARRADLLPSLSFSGSIGLQSSEADGLFNVDQWFRNLVANVTAPIFQGGRLRANLSGAHGQFNQLAAAYGRAVVTAVHEVEAALNQFANERRRFDFLTSQRADAQASMDLQAQRYASGVAGYTDYLDALRTMLNVESTLAGAGRDLALARLAVHRSLGGTWTQELEDPSTMMVPERDLDAVRDPNRPRVEGPRGASPVSGKGAL